ncbi:C6 zinc finger domain protein [Chaetomidium leptoderma]|uniref:C6 zinc finger domain protein n=1 Tax=Chaetomidium leptoderma TaxID=669021 RepID=A0AAN6ZWU3_9PEZI|nr:C6 zinc finger domain protein [Chaetomidium leptoderma]
MPTDNPAKPQRVLACLLCQQRKVKCDRKFPCANCVRIGAQVQCVPATLAPRQRRRRFPERELLARIRHYEALLHQHNVPFEPLHPPAAPTENSTTTPSNLESPDAPQSTVSAQSEGEPSTQTKAVKPRATNLWHALSEKNFEPHDDGADSYDDDESDGGVWRDDHDLRDAVIKKTLNRTYHNASESNHHLLFGSPASTVALATLHPDQAKIFRLWQIYLDNVNPLLKVTHTPSLQARIVDAMGDLANISAPLEALMFSIYCVSVMSLAEDQCPTLFASPKKDLLAGYQFACRQALLNANVLQSEDYDCLTALYLYLVSARFGTDPRSISSMLAVAVRTAQRLGYHNESDLIKCTPLEAEMRRRLWWSLAIFDTRVCETFNYSAATLAPTWNCKTPLNLNDSELLPDMKTVPPVHDKPTEALFVLVRSTLSDLIRRCAFHLDSIDPFLATFAQAKNTVSGTGQVGGQELLELQKTVEEKTFALCDLQNPLHFMTIWTARACLARALLMEHCSRQRDAPQQGPGLSYALRMLECDTHLMNSPLVKGFRWHVHFHFPFLGYIYIVQHFKTRPADDDRARMAWEVMGDNYEARRMAFSEATGPLFVLFSRIVLQAWEAVLKQDDKGKSSREPPRIVTSLQSKIAQMRSSMSQLDGNTEQFTSGGGTINLDGPETTMPMLNVSWDVPNERAFTAPLSRAYPDMLSGDAGMNLMDMDHFWPAMDWGLMQGRPW